MASAGKNTGHVETEVECGVTALTFQTQTVTHCDFGCWTVDQPQNTTYAGLVGDGCCVLGLVYAGFFQQGSESFASVSLVFTYTDAWVDLRTAT